MNVVWNMKEQRKLVENNKIYLRLKANADEDEMVSF